MDVNPYRVTVTEEARRVDCIAPSGVAISWSIIAGLASIRCTQAGHQRDKHFDSNQQQQQQQPGRWIELYLAIMLTAMLAAA